MESPDTAATRNAGRGLGEKRLLNDASFPSLAGQLLPLLLFLLKAASVVDGHRDVAAQSLE